MVSYFLRFPGGKRKALTFSYDDGVAEDIRLVDIFRSHHMRATFNICSGLFGPDDGIIPPGRKHRKLSRQEVLDLYTPDVCEVASHCVSHAFLSTCAIGSACLEVIEDRKNLESLFGHQIHGFVYPNGAYNDAVVDMLKAADIYYARTVISTLNFDMPRDWLRMPATCHHKNPQLMELADTFLELIPRYEPKVFYVWGHSYEFADQDNWHVIEDFADKMADKEDIWYATNMEIYTAWRDFTRLERSVDGTNIFNPGCRSVWIGDLKGNTYEIGPGQTVTLP